MEALKTIVITGCNKGVGYGILEKLIQQPYRIIMACRNLELANSARQQLLKKYNLQENKIETIELDISNTQSIDKFLIEFEQKFKKADVLINNAGIAINGDDFNATIVATTFKTNFYGTVEMSERFLSHLNDNGKIITIGSSVGKIRNLKNDKLIQRFQKEDISREELFNLAQEFYDDVNRGDFAAKGWPEYAYGMSKLCINTYARVLAKKEEVIQKKLQVMVCCPGWCRTDMAGQNAELSIEEGALTPVFLVELPFVVDAQYQGKFIYLKKVQQL